MTLTQIREYLRPATLDEAVALRREHGTSARFLAGGTDLTIHPPPDLEVLIDLGGLGLRFIEDEPDGITIGAGATLTDLIEHPAVAGHCAAVIPPMLVKVGSPLLRNAATIGGHLARAKLSDIVPVFLVLEATVTVFDGDHHTMSLLEYYEQGWYNEPAVLTRIRLPALPGSRAAFARQSRTGFDLAFLNVAVRLRGAEGAVAEARIVLGDTPGLYGLVPEAEADLTGSRLNGSVAERVARLVGETAPVGSDTRASAEYRSQLAYALTKRCLHHLGGVE